MRRHRRRWLALTLAAVLLAVTGIALRNGAAPAGAATTASWQYAPAAAPPPPTGVSPSPFPTGLGTVGDIEFYSPNQGLLITGGTSFVSAGLYAYDGTGWHQLSTVCGSAEGKIAYVSADEWWTISDQRPGLGLPDYSGSGIYDAVSLCHFENGQVVGSYAVPVDESDSWPELDAAACSGPDDCWFAGGFSGTTDGAFHLYWNGQTLTETDNTTEEHAVGSMAVDDGQIYESVTIGSGDSYSPSENASAPTLVHWINASDASDPFEDVELTDSSCVGYCPSLPSYGLTTAGTAVTPDDLSAFQLSSDNGSEADPASPGQMFALATPNDSDGAHPIVLHYTNSDQSWQQIVPNDASFPSDQDLSTITAIPGEDAAWVTVANDGSHTASLDLLSSGDDGSTWSVSEQTDIGPAQGVGDLGYAGPVACPTANDCWLATSQGWLFHYTDDTANVNATDGYGQSSDPVYNGSDGVITYRPADDGTPVVPGTNQPSDNSLANQAPAETIIVPTQPGAVRKVALVTDEKAKLIKGTDKLRFTFKLRAKARVQLLALRRERVGAAVRGKSGKAAKGGKVKTVTVARSRREVLKAGKRSLIVKLSPRRWPTSLKLNASVWKK